MAATGQQIAYRCDQCGSPEIGRSVPALRAGDPQLLRTLHLRGQPILHCEDRLATVSPQLRTSILWLGICNLLLCLLGDRWLSWDIATSAKDRIP